MFQNYDYLNKELFYSERKTFIPSFLEESYQRQEKSSILFLLLTSHKKKVEGNFRKNITEYMYISGKKQHASNDLKIAMHNGKHLFLTLHFFFFFFF